MSERAVVVAVGASAVIIMSWYVTGGVQESRSWRGRVVFGPGRSHGLEEIGARVEDCSHHGRRCGVAGGEVDRINAASLRVPDRRPRDQPEQLLLGGLSVHQGGGQRGTSPAYHARQAV